MKAYLVHGMNVRDYGANTIDKLTPYLRRLDAEVVNLDYPWFGTLRSKICNAAMAMMLAAEIDEDSIIFGHSNGCAIIYQMARLGVEFVRATLINPALKTNLAIPGYGPVHVWHSTNDMPVLVAKYVPDLFVPKTWGAQGRTGYIGKEEYRYFNHNMGAIGHSGAFLNPFLLEKIATTGFCGESQIGAEGQA